MYHFRVMVINKYRRLYGNFAYNFWDLYAYTSKRFLSIYNADHIHNVKHEVTVWCLFFVYLNCFFLNVNAIMFSNINAQQATIQWQFPHGTSSFLTIAYDCKAGVGRLVRAIFRDDNTWGTAIGWQFYWLVISVSCVEGWYNCCL